MKLIKLKVNIKVKYLKYKARVLTKNGGLGRNNHECKC